MSEVAGTRAAKHALLRQMGVDVWLARKGADDPLAALSAAARADASVPESPIPAPPVPQVAATAPAPSTPMPDTPAAESVKQAAPAVAPFSVICMSKGPALMLVEPGQSKAHLRFCLDVLAAASGEYGGGSAQVAFNWPQPGVENNQHNARKALGAFVAKQLTDQAPGLVLVEGSTADRLETVPEQSLRLAPLSELMINGEQKRALWIDLEARR